MFSTINEVYSWLYVQKKLDKRKDLSRIERCIKELDLSPSYPIVHIAGTNGKGSTAAYIKEILSHTGRHVGLFVSPYVISFNERIQVNERYISNAEILYYSNLLYTYSKDYYEKYQDVIPFFELTLLMALQFFKDRQIDIAVIECGLGGKLDATNILPVDYGIITNIGFDHMAQLGNTLEEIAEHKLGIFKKNMECYTTVSEDLKPQFLAHCEKEQASLHFVDSEVTDISVSDKTYFSYKKERFHSKLLGSYQAYNAALAIEVVRQIEPTIPSDIIQYGFDHVFWPGRFEVLQKEPLILLDGGHNIPAIQALVENVCKLKGKKRVKVIFTALVDKAYGEMIHILDAVSDFYYFTSIQDTRSTDAHLFQSLTPKESKVISNYQDCISIARDELKEEEILLICGSLHFISLVRENFLKKIKE